MRKRVYAKTGGLCWYCGDEADTVDHFIPLDMHKRKTHNQRFPWLSGLRRRGFVNLVPACEDCNQLKTNLLLHEFRGKAEGMEQCKYHRGADGRVRFFGERFLPQEIYNVNV